MSAQSHKPRRFPRVGPAVAAWVVLLAPTVTLAADANGKLSKNFYRIPYSNGNEVRITRDYVDHGNSPVGNVGPMDMFDLDGQGSRIVAAADGEVIMVNDSLTECGCHKNYGGCANGIRIRHANGELSRYLHIRGNSAQVSVGDCVVQGQVIATEGDVGWTCGSGRKPSSGSCVNSVPDGATRCARHLHWDVIREASDEFVNPMTCNISGNIYKDGGEYTAGSCATDACDKNVDVPTLVLVNVGSWRVYQASDTVEAQKFSIFNRGAAVFHAGFSVRLSPGFVVGPGGYFRAEIGPCNTTTNAGCP